ncbi:MAG TPA: hypothetical protein VFP44_17250 [Usitatibacter sp.]|nr:hypothetical protein [Usitatibacter sp.]
MDPSTNGNRDDEIAEEGEAGFNAGRRRFGAGLLIGGAGLLAAAARSAWADSTYMTAPPSAGKYPYTYRNTFPEGVGDFATTAEVGGDVFAPGMKPGDTLPADMTLFDESNKPHKVAEFLNGEPLILVFTLISAPKAMQQVAAFQKFVGQHKVKGRVVVLNVSQFGSSLQPKTPMADSGRTMSVAAKEYGIRLPLYWAENDIYSAKGLTNRLRIRDLPTFVVIQPDGRVAKVYGSDHVAWSPGDLAAS